MQTLVRFLSISRTRRWIQVGCKKTSEAPTFRLEYQMEELRDQKDLNCVQDLMWDRPACVRRQECLGFSNLLYNFSSTLWEFEIQLIPSFCSLLFLHAVITLNERGRHHRQDGLPPRAGQAQQDWEARTLGVPGLRCTWTQVDVPGQSRCTWTIKMYLVSSLMPWLGQWSGWRPERGDEVSLVVEKFFTEEFSFLLNFLLLLRSTILRAQWCFFDPH